MKIAINHKLEDLKEAIDQATITEKEVDLTDEEIKTILFNFSQSIQRTDFTVLLSYLSMKNPDTNVETLTQFIEMFINDAGFNVLSQMNSDLADAISQRDTLDSAMEKVEEIVAETE